MGTALAASVSAVRAWAGGLRLPCRSHQAAPTEVYISTQAAIIVYTESRHLEAIRDWRE